MSRIERKHLKANSKLYFVIYFLVVVLIFGGVIPYSTLILKGKYAIAKTLKRVNQKHGKTFVEYEYWVDGKRFEGLHYEREIISNKVKLEVPNGTYLVIYSDGWPHYNQLLEQFPISKEFNIDSLNNLGLDKSLVEFW